MIFTSRYRRRVPIILETCTVYTPQNQSPPRAISAIFNKIADVEILTKVGKIAASLKGEIMRKLRDFLAKFCRLFANRRGEIFFRVAVGVSS